MGTLSKLELDFGNAGFGGEGKTGVPGKKPLGAEKRTNNKLKPHMTHMLPEKAYSLRKFQNRRKV